MHFPGEDELDSFPIVSDFAVMIHDTHDRGGLIEFTSVSRGRLAWFPAWEHADRDLRHFTPADVPLGTLDEPFDDSDEEWRILLFEHGGFIYVLEGHSPVAEEFASSFRVPRNRYFEAWAALIDTYNPVTPLDETED